MCWQGSPSLLPVRRAEQDPHHSTLAFSSELLQSTLVMDVRHGSFSQVGQYSPEQSSLTALQDSSALCQLDVPGLQTKVHAACSPILVAQRQGWLQRCTSCDHWHAGCRCCTGLRGSTVTGRLQADSASSLHRWRFQV